MKIAMSRAGRRVVASIVALAATSLFGCTTAVESVTSASSASLTAVPTTDDTPDTTAPATNTTNGFTGESTSPTATGDDGVVNKPATAPTTTSHTVQTSATASLTSTSTTATSAVTSSNATAEPSVTSSTTATSTTTINPVLHTVTLSIDCETVRGVATCPANGWILGAVAVEFAPGESVFELLKRETRAHGIHMAFRNSVIYNSAYVEAIHNLYEFDGGSESGWMYSVNGWFPNYGASQYKLKDGDVIKWRYTRALGRDIGGSGALG